MRLSDEERAELPRELFALVTRRLEYAIEKAMDGQGRDVPADRALDLSARLHDVGQDLRVIADAIATITAHNVLE